MRLYHDASSHIGLDKLSANCVRICIGHAWANVLKSTFATVVPVFWGNLILGAEEVCGNMVVNPTTSSILGKSTTPDLW
jgi:hypothetical protein